MSRLQAHPFPPGLGQRLEDQDPRPRAWAILHPQSPPSPPGNGEDDAHLPGVWAGSENRTPGLHSAGPGVVLPPHPHQLTHVTHVLSPGGQGWDRDGAMTRPALRAPTPVLHPHPAHSSAAPAPHRPPPRPPWGAGLHPLSPGRVGLLKPHSRAAHGTVTGLEDCVGSWPAQCPTATPAALGSRN